MKRLHIHQNITPDALPASTAFYETLFGAAPTTQKPGYVKWLLDDPRVNFVLETSEGESGIHHVGIQVDTAEELDGLRDDLRAAEAPLLDIGETECCFAKSNKAWTMDPNGLRWEAFRTHGDVAEYGAKTAEEQRLYHA